MTQTAHVGTREDSVELLGLVARLQLEGFARAAQDSALAPTLAQRLELTRFAAGRVLRQDRALARLSELGGVPAAVLGEFDHLLDDFDARTAPSTWAERLLTSYVGYGVADDFCRLVAVGADTASHDLVVDLLADTTYAELVVGQLAQSCGQDDVLRSRLALWGRRLGGEALGVVQVLLARPALRRLAGLEATDGAAPDQTPSVARLFAELTAEHTRRMARLGLTA